MLRCDAFSRLQHRVMLRHHFSKEEKVVPCKGIAMVASCMMKSAMSMSVTHMRRCVTVTVTKTFLRFEFLADVRHYSDVS
mmetsp:Transcript_29586/g.60705  ORF Transcript_29586/g.60705 Transcript_29586/m.60705 type:complete len:80 (-) Transcript_29586:278-517(-)